LGTWNAPSGYSRHRRRGRGRRTSASAPAYVRYTVLALAAALVVTLGWRGVRWTMHPAQRQMTNAPMQDASAPADAHSSDTSEWQRDFTYALASATTDAEAGNIAAAEISVDRAENFVTVARLQSRAAPPELFVPALAQLDRILKQRPDDTRLLEHVTLARISLAELASSQAAAPDTSSAADSAVYYGGNPAGGGGGTGEKPYSRREVDPNVGKRISISAPREIAAGETLDRKSFGGSYLDATLMPDTAEILLPPFTRAFADNIRVENLTIEGAAQTLDGIRWRNVTFIGTRLRYEGGELDLQNVQFVRCRFGFPSDDRGARLANAIALGHTSFDIE
jgi:hypothetical protein